MSEPQIGDVIRTATPLNTDSLSHRAGDYLHAELSTRECVDEARKLIESGRWVLVEKLGKDGAQ